jgi:SAM-dependent methyltransferase
MTPRHRTFSGRRTALTGRPSRRFSAQPGWPAAWPPPGGGLDGSRWRPRGRYCSPTPAFTCTPHCGASCASGSGYSPGATLANAAAAGVADRVEVHTADMTALPFADGSFDVVTSALAIHNIPSPEGRYRAVDEAMRVLRPGGQLLVADFWPMARKYAAHIGQGTLRGLGPGYWYGGPWLGTTLLHAVKERR